jgi:hypothetical protein
MRGNNVHLSQIDRLDCTFCRQARQNVPFNPHAELGCTFLRRLQED